MEEGFSLFATSKKRTAPIGTVPEAVNSPPATACIKSKGGSEVTFQDILDPWLVKTLTLLHISTPTLVQAACIPKIKEKLPVVAVAKTGSGKTLSFGLPIVNELARDPRSMFALILSPTRELALQIHEQLSAICVNLNMRISVFVGGMDMMNQAIEFSRKPHIIVATPGRLLDLFRSNQDLEAPRLQYVVFDEADRLLADNSSFMKEEIPEILDRISKYEKTQYLFFSATMPKAVLGRIEQICGTVPFVYNENSICKLPAEIVHEFILTPNQVRDVQLYYLLSDKFKERNVIVFVNSCKTCEIIDSFMSFLKLKVVSLHSKLTQRKRIANLSKYRNGKSKILLCTDVGGRGLDIPSVDIVINYNLPNDCSDYVHRVGRSGRAGRKGLAISLVGESEAKLFDYIQTSLNFSCNSSPSGPEQKKIIELLPLVSGAKRKARLKCDIKTE